MHVPVNGGPVFPGTILGYFGLIKHFLAEFLLFSTILYITLDFFCFFCCVFVILFCFCFFFKIPKLHSLA